MEIRVIRAIRVLLNIEILVFLGLNIYKGACMSTTIHQTKSYLYLPDTNIKLIRLLWVLLRGPIEKLNCYL